MRLAQQATTPQAVTQLLYHVPCVPYDPTGPQEIGSITDRSLLVSCIYPLKTNTPYQPTERFAPFLMYVPTMRFCGAAGGSSLTSAPSLCSSAESPGQGRRRPRSISFPTCHTAAAPWRRTGGSRCRLQIRQTGGWGGWGGWGAGVSSGGHRENHRRYGWVSLERLFVSFLRDAYGSFYRWK